MIPELNSLLCEFIKTPGLPLRFGTMFAAAMILGYILFKDRSDVWKLFITGVIYVIFQEWMRIAILVDLESDVTLRPAVLALAGAITYGIAISIGAGIGRMYRTTLRGIEAEAQATIKKMNGNSTA